jgi:hypothetical protein
MHLYRDKEPRVPLPSFWRMEASTAAFSTESSVDESTIAACSWSHLTRSWLAEHSNFSPSAM